MAKKDNIEALIAKLEPKIRKAFLQGIHRIKSSMDLKEIENLLQLGKIDEALRSTQAAIDKLANDIISYTIVAGKDTANLLEDVLNVQITFDQTNIRAVNAMRQNKLRMVREFTDEQRRATREALTSGITQGVNPRVQALAFRDSIGLTLKQQQAVNNYRRLLENNSSEALSRKLRDKRFDSSVERAIKDGQVLDKSTIDRMVTRYQERYIRYRSEVIARTEALRSAHEGSEEMYAQAIESGSLNPEKLIRTWVTAKDERVRSSHAAMSGQTRAIGQPFTTGEGFNLMRPGDSTAPASETVQCRCIVTTTFK